MIATKNKLFLLYAVTSAIFLCTTSAFAVNADFTFSNVTDETGIDFRHYDGSGGKYYIMETVASGLALFDYDNDGDVDIYFLNGAALKGTDYKKPPENKLYRNDGNWKFTDVTSKSGLGDKGFGLGVTVGDYDNDGYKDVYLNNYGPNKLLRNNGDGTFVDVTAAAGVGDENNVGAGACFLDMDGDGDLDLYVSRYIVFSYDKNVIMMIDDKPFYTNPAAYEFPHDRLYRNNSDGTFADVSKESGIAEHKGPGMGMVCGDYDNDSDTDIFIANDSYENFLFENDGKGNFQEVAMLAGVAYDLNGYIFGNMGADWGDYDNDGLMDLYVTSYASQSASLYRNLGDGLFDDVTYSSGAGAGTYPNPTWGTGFVDFDNDGDRDIFVAVGHLHDNIEKVGNNKNVSYFARNEVLMNTGDGKFVNVTDSAGDGMKVVLSSRGAGFDDLDNDGDIDVVILNSRREATILRNDTENKKHWMKIKLKGVKTNRDGVGARVKVITGNLSQINEVHSGRGYQGHYGSMLHFGMGDKKKIDAIEIKWLGGETERIENINANQRITITEGKGITK